MIKHKSLLYFLIVNIFLWNSFFYVPQVRADSTPSDQTTPVQIENQSIESQPASPPSSEVTQTEITNTADVTTNAQTTSSTGNNTIDTTTPTPTPEDSSDSSIAPPPQDPQTTQSNDSNPTPTPTPLAETLVVSSPTSTPSSQITNSGQIENNTTSLANSGNNNLNMENASPEASLGVSPTPTSTPSAISTGNSISSTVAENSVNTTSLNSRIIYQTINIFTTEKTLDLTNLNSIVSEIINVKKNTDPTINIATTNLNNFTYLTNTIVSIANTGGNNIAVGGDAVINTDNAYSVVSLLNKVNVVLIDSTIHIIAINIFGKLDGNIILPVLSQTTNNSTCQSNCGSITTVNNSADITNNISSLAISGENSATAEKNANITTGTSTSIINTNNIVNSVMAGVTFYDLILNTYGTWNGSFLGWDIFDPSGNGNLSLVGATPTNNIPTDSNLSTSISNTAVIVNNISSQATSGNNNAQGKNANITTGGSYSVISLFNLVNTTLIKSVGFFGFINIFGTLNGDIGGEDKFVATDDNLAENNPAGTMTSDNNNDNEEPTRDEGGLLEITQTNNVGDYVLPGDTVTFFITVKNTGNGRVYDSKLTLSLIKDGIDMGGAEFYLGDIRIGGTIKFVTGLVLSKNAAGGNYVVQAMINGSVGKDNREISETADSTFRIFAPNATFAINQPPIVKKEAVLGIKTPSDDLKIIPKDYTQMLRLVLLALLGLYVAQKSKRKNIIF
ncbi:MAG: hypothetical protein HY424_03305 [Candidatus Levybacteria bacterium]|nr:hypothetical protein [Candidatus Levybacteria bacterium]